MGSYSASLCTYSPVDDDEQIVIRDSLRRQMRSTLAEIPAQTLTCYIDVRCCIPSRSARIAAGDNTVLSGGCVFQQRLTVFMTSSRRKLDKENDPTASGRGYNLAFDFAFALAFAFVPPSGTRGGFQQFHHKLLSVHLCHIQWSSQRRRTVVPADGLPIGNFFDEQLH